MSDALQVAVFVACTALTVLVACVLPILAAAVEGGKEAMREERAEQKVPA